MIEYIVFVEDQAKNREELAKDVEGVKCTYVGPVNSDVFNESLFITLFTCISDNQHFGTIEAYANGRFNVYVKEGNNPVAVGFLRVTPKSPDLDFSK